MLGNQMRLGFDHFKIEGRRPVGPCSQSRFSMVGETSYKMMMNK